MRSTLSAQLNTGSGEGTREILIRDDDRILTAIWEALVSTIAAGEPPHHGSLLLGTTNPTGQRRRGVTDAPPAEFSDEDFDVITINDEERLEQLVFTEQKVAGRKGRPPRSYRVDAAIWGPCFRLMKLIFPEIAETWAPQKPWWVESENILENESGTERIETIDVASLHKQTPPTETTNNHPNNINTH